MRAKNVYMYQSRLHPPPPTPHNEVAGSSVAAERMSRGSVNYQPLVSLVVTASMAKRFNYGCPIPHCAT